MREINRAEGEPWFVAKDVAEILGFSETAAMTRSLDDDEKTNLHTTQDGTSYTTRTTIINESGLYSAILKSRRPEARAFKRWVTREVLPTIRKTGGYVSNDEMFVDTYLPFADDTQKKRLL